MGWLSNALTWLSRATGIGYRPYPALSDVVQAHRVYELRRNSDRLVVEVQQLERELRRSGQLPRNH